MSSLRKSIGCLFVVLCCVSPVLSQRQLLTITGLPVYNQTATIAAGGDLNGDGYDDIVWSNRFDSSVAPSAGLVVAVSGRDGSQLFSIHGPNANHLLGAQIALVGDVNADGYCDVICSHSAAYFPDRRGYAEVYSGLDGALLLNLTGAVGEGLGAACCGLGDLNLDGHADFAVSSVSAGGVPFPLPPPSVGVFSGIDGSLMFRITQTLPDNTGVAVAGPGDVDGDGIPDLLLGAGDQSLVQSPNSRVHSGVDGSLIHDISDGHLGSLVDRVGDVDQDGHADLLIASRLSKAYRIFSGQNLAVLHDVWVLGFGSTNHFSVGGAGDITGDGYPDFLLGLPRVSGAATWDGRALLYSGADGSVVNDQRGVSLNTLQLGWGTGAAGDVNGDGVDDYFVYGADGSGTASPRIVVFSGHRARLTAPSSHSLSTQIGPLGSRLDFGLTTTPPLPGHHYWFEVSFDGTTPGMLLGGQVFPLQPPFIHVSHGAAFPNHFENFWSTFDASGAAVMRVHLPADPALFGQTLHGAVLIHEPQAADQLGVSNPVSVLIQP